MRLSVAAFVIGSNLARNAGGHLNNEAPLWVFQNSTLINQLILKLYSKQWKTTKEKAPLNATASRKIDTACTKCIMKYHTSTEEIYKCPHAKMLYYHNHRMPKYLYKHMSSPILSRWYKTARVYAVSQTVRKQKSTTHNTKKYQHKF